MHSTNSNKKTDFSKHVPSFCILDSLEADVKARTSSPKFPYGVPQVDNLIWGFHKKELLIIGARPSNGKTSFALQGAWNLGKMGVPTVFASLEMSKENIVERLCCNEFSINGWKLRQGDLNERKRFHESIDKMRSRLLSSKFEIIDYAGRTIQQVEEILEHFKPEFLFIDHAQKITPSGYGNKYEALSDYVNRLQDLAIKNDCGIVLNSQINRGGEFLKGSGDLEEAADTLIYCTWKIKNKDGEDPKEFQIEVQKQRHGACDYAIIDFDAGFYRFSERAFWEKRF